MHVTELGLSPAALARLEAAGITEVEQLVARPATDLLRRGRFSAAELYEIVGQLSQHGLSLPPIRGGRIRVSSERDLEMFRLRVVERLTLAEVGERTGVSQERVRQILRLHFGLTGTPPRPRGRPRQRR
jgi:Sigma-70, region 4